MADQDREPAQAARQGCAGCPNAATTIRKGRETWVLCASCAAAWDRITARIEAAPPSAAPTLDDEAIWDRVDDGTLMIEQDANESDMVQVSMSKVVHDRIIAALRAAAPSSGEKACENCMGTRREVTNIPCMECSNPFAAPSSAAAEPVSPAVSFMLDPPEWAMDAQERAAAAEPVQDPHEWMEKLRRVSAVVCWLCRSVTYREDYYALDGCGDCGAKSSENVMVLPIVFRPRVAEPVQDDALVALCWRLGFAGIYDTFRSVYDAAEQMGLYIQEAQDAAGDSAPEIEGASLADVIRTLAARLRTVPAAPSGAQQIIDAAVKAGAESYFPGLVQLARRLTGTVPANEQRLRDALTQAAHWFDEYVMVYGAKGDDHRKMLNLSRARACRAAIDVPSPPAERTEP